MPMFSNDQHFLILRNIKNINFNEKPSSVVYRIFPDTVGVCETKLK